ncbi:uncharacterized protein METZ01_LOCUS292964, partial [marine metagenome]
LGHQGCQSWLKKNGHDWGGDWGDGEDW